MNKSYDKNVTLFPGKLYSWYRCWDFIHLSCLSSERLRSQFLKLWSACSLRLAHFYFHSFETILVESCSSDKGWMIPVIHLLTDIFIYKILSDLQVKIRVTFENIWTRENDLTTTVPMPQFRAFVQWWDVESESHFNKLNCSYLHKKPRVYLSSLEGR